MAAGTLLRRFDYVDADSGNDEGLNVVEQWNSINDFIFFARRGEMASNRREDHEISMLARHLLQNCMLYINTLMQQQVMAQPQWSGSLPPEISAP